MFSIDKIFRLHKLEAKMLYMYSMRTYWPDALEYITWTNKLYKIGVAIYEYPMVK